MTEILMPYRLWSQFYTRDPDVDVPDGVSETPISLKEFVDPTMNDFGEAEMDAVHNTLNPAQVLHFLSQKYDSGEFHKWDNPVGIVSPSHLKLEMDGDVVFEIKTTEPRELTGTLLTLVGMSSFTVPTDDSD
mgnify:CR=1 FL=1